MASHWLSETVCQSQAMLEIIVVYNMDFDMRLS